MVGTTRNSLANVMVENYAPGRCVPTWPGTSFAMDQESSSSMSVVTKRSQVHRVGAVRCSIPRVSDSVTAPWYGANIRKCFHLRVIVSSGCARIPGTDNLPIMRQYAGPLIVMPRHRYTPYFTTSYDECGADPTMRVTAEQQSAVPTARMTSVASGSNRICSIDWTARVEMTGRHQMANRFALLVER
jgi:hypothetical protein